MTYAPNFFRWDEFDQHGAPGTGEAHMDRDFVRWLDELRLRCGFPLTVSSGYRSPEYNSTVSTTGLDGPHTTGKAADLIVLGSQALILIGHATDMGVKGMGIKQKGEHARRFIHLDMLGAAETKGPRPWIWSY